MSAAEPRAPLDQLAGLVVVLVVQKRALAMAVKGKQVERRWSKLQERLHDLARSGSTSRPGGSEWPGHVLSHTSS